MSKRGKLLVGILSILVLLLLAGSLFIRYQIRKSFPRVSGTLQLAGLEQPVDVARDEFGVPHIRAANEHDLFFALGLVHAQDRLWQMDLIRRSGEGRLSELFGHATLPFDRMFRIVGIRRISEAIEKSLPQSTLERLQWYADGVNAVITMQKGAYPLEFDLLGYQPELWTPLHTIIVGRMMAWELNISWWSDLTLGAISERVGLTKALDILPAYPPEVPPIVPEAVWRQSARLTSGYLKTSQQYLAFRGIESIAGGSNAWVVNPSRSASKKVLLANDTHLRLTLPAQWYEVQLRTPDINVRGMSVPGAPAVVAGRNDSIAWGLTNVMADDADFFVEKVDSADSSTYLYNDRWLPMTVLNEEIGVRGDSARAVTIRLTRHGPVVTDITTPIQLGRYPYVASMEWTGAGIDDQFDALWRIDRARNWKEFTQGVRAFAVPGQNFVYGDEAGNIGYWCGVKIPIRSMRHSILPLPGWDPGSDWKGYVPFEKLPHLFNPPEGFIATANNKIVDDTYPYDISDLWESPSRFLRLREVLSKKGEVFSVEDFERLQNDDFSFHAREIVPFILDAYPDSISASPDEKRALEYLRNWHCRFAKEDIAAAVYQEFFVRLLENTFRDEMGPELYHDFVLLTNIPVRVITKLLQEGSSEWFDDVTTPAIETRDDMIRKSLREGLQALHERLGDDPKSWRWGELHTVTLQHPFGLRKPLDVVFNIGPFPFPGGTTTLVSGEYDFNQPFAVTVGPSYRAIYDMANPGEVRSVLPSGESGQALHPHYRDQTELWLNGAYRIELTEDRDGHWDHLRLEPVR